MTRAGISDPIDRLSRRERREWRAAAKRVQRVHEIDQMATLNGLAAAGSGVTGVSGDPEATAAGLATAPVELIIEGRRLRVGRIHRPTLAKLRDAMSRAAALPLTRVGRYGPYWVLTFRLATEQLVLLADHLTLLPDLGGPGGRELAPAGPLSSAGA